MKILAALGGNAILNSSEKGTKEEQLANLNTTAKQLAQLVKRGHRISITHGNGPQVGDLLLMYELARGTLPQMPLDVCGAESQGMIGYLLQQYMENALKKLGLKKPIVTLLTQTIVDENDPAMRDPTKPIGPVYSEREAKRLARKNGWIVKQDSNRGFRRVVPSPRPKEVVEERIAKDLFEREYIIIHSGGGGIPVVRDRRTGQLRGIEAVIDKDMTASIMAAALEVDIFLILTDVSRVYLNYGKANQKALSRLSAAECTKYLNEGQFASGSMAPKIQAARDFVTSTKGKAIIGSLDKMLEALDGKSGTIVTQS